MRTELHNSLRDVSATRPRQKRATLTQRISAEALARAVLRVSSRKRSLGRAAYPRDPRWPGQRRRSERAAFGGRFRSSSPGRSAERRLRYDLDSIWLVNRAGKEQPPFLPRLLSPGLELGPEHNGAGGLRRGRGLALPRRRGRGRDT